MEKASGDNVPTDFSEFCLVCGIQTKINLNPAKGLGFSRGESLLCVCVIDYCKYTMHYTLCYICISVNTSCPYYLKQQSLKMH